MTDIDRIAHLLEQTFEGDPYYGPSLLGLLDDVTVDLASRAPCVGTHRIWDLVLHLTAELDYARAVIEGTAGPWVAGETTWPVVISTTPAAWEQAIAGLEAANRALVRAVKQLNDCILDQDPIRVRGPYYLMLHGTMQHTIYHTGQIALLARRGPQANPEQS